MTSRGRALPPQDLTTLARRVELHYLAAAGVLLAQAIASNA